MKHVYNLIFLLTISTYGCNKIEENVIMADDITLTSRSVNDFTDICETCNAFNNAYPRYQSIFAQGIEDYELNDGCCEDCFKKDVSKGWDGICSVQDEHFILMFKSMERNGGSQLVHPDCEIFAFIPRLEDALDRTLIKYQNVINSVNINPNKSKCEKPIIDGPDPDGGSSECEDILFDLDAYNFAFEESSEWLVASIGGDVEQWWLSGGHDLNLLKICYALNQKSKIDPYREEINGNIGYMHGDNDYPYIVNHAFLYRYLCSFVTPELLTLEELAMKREIGIVIAKEAAENDIDVLEGFGDVWDGRYFMSGDEIISTEFYFFEIN